MSSKSKPRLSLLEKQAAPADSVPHLEKIEKGMGKIPNIFKAMAHSPTALAAYLDLSGGLKKSTLSERTRESVALAIAELTGCHYCLSAHTVIGRMIGLGDDEMMVARTGRPADAKERAAVDLAREIINTHGNVSDATIQAARAAGLTDREQLDLLVAVTLNMFTNYVNHFAQTPIDFPKAPDLPEE